MNRRTFPDDPPDVIHGINCDCDDSCLEYFCECGFSESSNGAYFQCPDCGEPIAPDCVDPHEWEEYEDRCDE